MIVVHLRDGRRVSYRKAEDWSTGNEYLTLYSYRRGAVPNAIAAIPSALVERVERPGESEESKSGEPVGFAPTP